MKACRYEFACENGCFAVPVVLAIKGRILTKEKTLTLDAGEAKTLKFKTVKRERKTLKRALRKGKRSLKRGGWDANRIEIVPVTEQVMNELEGQGKGYYSLDEGNVCQRGGEDIRSFRVGQYGDAKIKLKR